jgi:manganese oxidase
LDWDNLDFDVNLIVSDAATDRAGQLFFDVFALDGFLGDIPLVNLATRPFCEVLPQVPLSHPGPTVSRWWMSTLADASGRALPSQFIANDGNLLVSPVALTSLPQQGNGERYDIVVDFSHFRVGDKIRLSTGRRCDRTGPVPSPLS